MTRHVARTAAAPLDSSLGLGSIVPRRWTGKRSLSFAGRVCLGSSVSSLFRYGIEPGEEFGPYTRVRLPADQDCKMLQAGARLSWKFDDPPRLRPNRINKRLDRSQRGDRVGCIDDRKCRN